MSLKIISSGIFASLGEHLLKSLCLSFCADIINSFTRPVSSKFNVGEFYEKFVELCQFYWDIGQKLLPLHMHFCTYPSVTQQIFIRVIRYLIRVLEKN